LGRDALHLRGVAGVELEHDVLGGLIREAIPPVLAVDSIEVRRVVVVPDAHPMRPEALGHLVDGGSGRLQQFGRLVHRRRQRTDDQVAIADRLVELDARRKLVALQLGEAVMEAARPQPGRIEVRAPKGAGLAKSVLELDRLIPHGAQRLERAWYVGGQFLADAPELRRDGDLLPGCGARPRSQQNRSGGSAAEPEDFATRRTGVAHESGAPTVIPSRRRSEALARRVRLDPEAVKRKRQLSATTCPKREWEAYPHC
jgi:hypothetical protein